MFLYNKLLHFVCFIWFYLLFACIHSLYFHHLFQMYCIPFIQLNFFFFRVFRSKWTNNHFKYALTEVFRIKGSFLLLIYFDCYYYFCYIFMHNSRETVGVGMVFEISSYIYLYLFDYFQYIFRYPSEEIELICWISSKLINFEMMMFNFRSGIREKSKWICYHLAKFHFKSITTWNVLFEELHWFIDSILPFQWFLITFLWRISHTHVSKSNAQQAKLWLNRNWK